MELERLRKFPPEVTVLLRLGGWLVGSAVTDEKPKDYDILFEPAEWDKAQSVLPSMVKEGLRLTRFGGIRFYIGETAIDVWSTSLANYILRCPGRGFAYNGNTNKMISWE